MISFPTNTTGAVMRKEHLEAIAEVCIKHDLIVISDEIYAELTYGDKHVSIASLPGMRERTVLINGFSKAYAMTGWRVGFLGAPLNIAKACDKYQGQITSATCSIAQRATIAALEKAPQDIPEISTMLSA
jgi:aspartate/methionine/tyrosine aminotransferase